MQIGQKCFAGVDPMLRHRLLEKSLHAMFAESFNTNSKRNMADRG